MQIHFSFSESYPIETVHIPFSWLFCAQCLQVKLQTLTAVKVWESWAASGLG